MESETSPEQELPQQLPDENPPETEPGEEGDAPPSTGADEVPPEESEELVEEDG